MLGSHVPNNPVAHPRGVPSLGRRFRIAVSALALSALIGLGAGASTSRADVGSVYFDNHCNAAAGRSLFNGTFTGAANVGLGDTVMPSLTSGNFNVAVGEQALFDNTTGSHNVATGSLRAR